VEPAAPQGFFRSGGVSPVAFMILRPRATISPTVPAGTSRSWSSKMRTSTEGAGNRFSLNDSGFVVRVFQPEIIDSELDR
jgi:hypothetical protein